MSKINFHFHSYYSDGTHTIPEIAKIINDEDNLKYVCLTDHDTVSGVEELQKLVSKTKIIPGIELTAKYDNNTFFHILGINVNPVKMMHFLMPYGKKYNKKFAKAFNKFKKDNGLVFNLNLNQFQKSPWINPWDFNKEMKRLGYFKNDTKNIEDMQSHGLNIPIKKVIAAIHKCGGIAIWAHPYHVFSYNDKKKQLSYGQIEAYLQKLIKWKIDGIEAYYYHFDDTQRNNLLKLADKKHLLISAGTDYHDKPDRPYGHTVGYELPDDVIEKIIKSLNLEN